MLLNKLKTATVVMMLFVAALSGGAGLIYQTQAAEQPKAQGATEKIEQKDAQATRPTETLAQKVMLAYIHNDAKGDEEFLGKWLSVRGRVRGVERVVIGKGPHYLLTLYNAPSEDRFGTVFPVSDKMALAFVFPSSSRKQLAKLQGGQEVTIEGVCEGRTAEGHDAISFTDCKIVKPKE